jgi:hypothetical protein
MLSAIKQVLPTPLKAALRTIRSHYRYSTSKWRVLPDFLIIGAMRSGTTSLFSHLLQHPHISGSYEKETHYFDWNYWRGEGWYRSNFPLKYSVKTGTLVGEATPYYIFHPHAPKRIHALLPNARLIVLLRDPTDRAISHYFFSAAADHETLPIMEALLAEDKRIQPELDKMLQDESYFSTSHIWSSYKLRGLYLDQLRRYWEYFDRERILIVKSQHLFKSPKDTLRKVFEFLGVEPETELRDLSARNTGWNKVEVHSDVYQYLDDFFSPFNERLYTSIDQDFGW